MSASKSGNESLLLGGLDGIGAIVGADPGDRADRSMTGHDGEAGQCGAGASVATEAADLHPFSGASPFEHHAERGPDLGSIGGYAEIRPVEVIMAPWRLPPLIQVQPVGRRLVARIWVDRVE